jgi:hypothetical protein
MKAAILFCSVLFCSVLSASTFTLAVSGGGAGLGVYDRNNVRLGDYTFILGETSLLSGLGMKTSLGTIMLADLSAGTVFALDSNASNSNLPSMTLSFFERLNLYYSDAACTAPLGASKLMDDIIMPGATGLNRVQFNSAGAKFDLGTYNQTHDYYEFANGVCTVTPMSGMAVANWIYPVTITPIATLPNYPYAGPLTVK